VTQVMLDSNVELIPFANLALINVINAAINFLVTGFMP
jgi:hypothetical protein